MEAEDSRHDSNSGAESSEEVNSLRDAYELDPAKRREARKMKRVMANRRSARESRERRKKLLTDLQESVESLTAENESLAKENTDLWNELTAALEQSGIPLSSLATVLPNLLHLTSEGVRRGKAIRAGAGARVTTGGCAGAGARAVAGGRSGSGAGVGFAAIGRVGSGDN